MLHVVLRVVFNLKTKPTPASRRQPKSGVQEPNKDSDAESSSLQAVPPVVSNIAGDKIIYGWDVQRLRRGRAIKAEKEKKK